MRSAIAIALLAAVGLVGCATTSPAPDPGVPPTMNVIEGRPEAPSAMDALQRAQAEVDAERATVAKLREEKASLEVQVDDLKRQLLEATRESLRLRTQSEGRMREIDALTGDLLDCRIEKAKLERRLLEIRLADLRRGDAEVAR